MSRKNNEFLAEKIGCRPATHLWGVAQKCDRAILVKILVNWNFASICSPQNSLKSSKNIEKRPEISRFQVFHMVEISGIEPLTS